MDLRHLDGREGTAFLIVNVIMRTNKLHHLPRLSSLTLIHPATDCDTIWYQLRPFQILDVVLYGSLELWKGQKVQVGRLQLLCGFGSKVLLNYAICIFVLKGKHATAGVLDEKNLCGSEELFGDYD